MTFKAVQVREEQGAYQCSVVDKDDFAQPGNGEVRVAVEYSSLNYKDALSAAGNKGVTRNYPHTPGIDAAGTVLASSSDNWKAGDRVIVTGYDLGMNTDGGLAEQIQVPGEWLPAAPDGLDSAEAMALGTAGLTAGLCVEKLQRQLGELSGLKIAVTGASGGVGSVAIALLNQLGAEVTAISGKAQQYDFLQSIGAQHCVAPSMLAEFDKKPMAKPLFDAAIDTLGGDPLANLLKIIQPEGAVACCGLAAGVNINSSVFPFILRGVCLLGVDSVEISQQRKADIWQRFAEQWKLDDAAWSALLTEITLEEVPDYLARFLEVSVSGRIRVKL